jgi:hypothetical protein
MRTLVGVSNSDMPASDLKNLVMVGEGCFDSRNEIRASHSNMALAEFHRQRRIAISDGGRDFSVFVPDRFALRR